jgi:hypothetical protein
VELRTFYEALRALIIYAFRPEDTEVANLQQLKISFGIPGEPKVTLVLIDI